MTAFSLQTLGLALLAACGYALATIGMKLGSGAMTALAVVLIAGGLIAAALTEVRILRQADLGVVYLVILVVETLIVLCVAWWLGEGLTPRQLGGAAVLVLGLTLVLR
ncbi:hypothetical protein [Wenxinia marina]|uniref:Uncharacterized protein n=1 Tax=Wenxinia marina DSM 24838 TaxID=1123501 RepID=A0A0D0PH82_9RHOB|nr:hypothetical protein [Wenxinia marina]KIQ70681.1 hypothetical protein Wenmar_01059 [Wenxinia marina DSM 24838]GGL51360.1 hypothetical protein GCM10011392_01940 [Wenxinia marina]